MPTTFHLVMGVAALVGMGATALLSRRLLRTWLLYRGTRVVVCPESRRTVAIAVDASHAALTASQGPPRLRLQSCSRWPERGDCGQACLAQVESAPEGCLLQTVLSDWYCGKACVFCGRGFVALQPYEPRPGFLSESGALVAWNGFPPESVVDVLATHRPVCRNCYVAEAFRREHPELVTDRVEPSHPRPSMS